MPNLVLLMADQLRADALGCYDNQFARTPALDGLAAGGARLGAHMTPNQICSPSRGTMFSGLYARHHGLVHNGITLPTDLELIPHALARAGYRTHGIGKFHFQPILAPRDLRLPESNAFWELSDAASWSGPYYGFETAKFVIGESAAATVGGHYARWLAEIAPEAVGLYAREQALAPPPSDLDEVWKCAIPEHLHYNSWIADNACRFLSAVGDEPFFLFVSFPDPHHPFTPPAPWCDLFAPTDLPRPTSVPGELRRMPDYVGHGLPADEDAQDGRRTYLEYLLSPGLPREQGFMTTTAAISEETLRLAIAHTYGAVAMIDDGIGRILQTLAATGLADDTFVVFTSDHGEFLGDHGLLHKGPPPYRQLLQVPFVIGGPGIAPMSTDALTSHVDIKATLLELLGVDGDPGDGTSFAPLLRGTAKTAREAIFAEYHPRAIAEQYNQTLITADWRLTLYPQERTWGELFNRRADPDETHNLFYDPGLADIRARLTARIENEWPPASDAGGPRIATY